MNLWRRWLPQDRIDWLLIMTAAVSIVGLLAGCETRTLQSCLASMVLLGPVQVSLQCPPHDAYLHGAPDLPGEANMP